MPGTMKKRADYPVPPPLGELTTAIHINVDEMPNHMRDALAESTLELIRNILRQPGGREALDARTRARKAALYPQGK